MVPSGRSTVQPLDHSTFRAFDHLTIGTLRRSIERRYDWTVSPPLVYRTIGPLDHWIIGHRRSDRPTTAVCFSKVRSTVANETNQTRQIRFGVITLSIA